MLAGNPAITSWDCKHVIHPVPQSFLCKGGVGDSNPQDWHFYNWHNSSPIPLFSPGDFILAYLHSSRSRLRRRVSISSLLRWAEHTPIAGSPRWLGAMLSGCQAHTALPSAVRFWSKTAGRLRHWPCPSRSLLRNTSRATLRLPTDPRDCRAGGNLPRMWVWPFVGRRKARFRSQLREKRAWLAGRWVAGFGDWVVQENPASSLYPSGLPYRKAQVLWPWGPVFLFIRSSSWCPALKFINTHTAYVCINVCIHASSRQYIKQHTLNKNTRQIVY